MAQNKRAQNCFRKCNTFELAFGSQWLAHASISLRRFSKASLLLGLVTNDVG
jgi:hypothetical protein